MILAYAEEDYENVTYTFDKIDEWFNKDKKDLGLDFPNLPYYIDGDLKLSQSMAIVRHLGRKYNLYGNTINESSMIDMLIDQAWDIKFELIKIAYNPDFVSYTVFVWPFRQYSILFRTT